MPVTGSMTGAVGAPVGMVSVLVDHATFAGWLSAQAVADGTLKQTPQAWSWSLSPSK